MTITASIDTHEIQKRLNELVKFSNRKLFTTIGDYVIFQITSRTAAGKNVNLLPFRPYSQKYKKVREKKGRPISKVDLFFTGKMLAAMTKKVNDNQVIIHFSTQEEASKAFYNNIRRKFFDLNKRDEKEIINMVSDRIEEITK